MMVLWFIVSGNSPLVAFTVVDQETRSYSSGARIEFPIIITNEGAGFIPGQHEFVCPVSGMYQFAYSTLSNWEQNSIAGIWIEDTLLVSSHASGPGNGEASNIVLVHCNSGNKVYVQCGNSACYPYGDYRNMHTFAGFLVSADVATL